MPILYLGAAALLLLNLLAGLARIYRGPSAADRLLAIQLFTTHTVAILALLALERPALADVALLLALLAALLAVAFVRLPLRAGHREDPS